MIKPYPPIKVEKIKRDGDDRNPAVQLFGRRFFVDQTVQEFLNEFLLVASVPKKIGNYCIEEDNIFPKIDKLADWPVNIPLEYAPKVRINLKLFSFLSSSKLETRHQSHKQHYQDLIKQFSANKLLTDKSEDWMDILQTLENVFNGFQGTGSQRTWCAKNFLPIDKHFITGESIWKKTAAIKNNIKNWEEAINFFSYNQHIYLARGGELLYLQICNALRQDKEKIKEWASKAGFSFTENELSPNVLRENLTNSIKNLLEKYSGNLGQLAEFIDKGIESKTSVLTEYDNEKNHRFTKCGWCPSDSWPEGYLFALEISRIIEAAIDPMERLELMQIACAFQVLRSLCAQSARYVPWAKEKENHGAPLNYIWAVSDPSGDHALLKQISRRCLNTIQKMIYDSIRIQEIKTMLEQQKEIDGANWKDPYREADRRYGYKLFVTLGKRIGFIVPQRGPGARFILNDKLMRFLVMSVINPGQKIRYNTFKDLIYFHYGIAIDKEKICKACEWTRNQKLSILGEEIEEWFIDMLESSGALIHLSDSHSIVSNPFERGSSKK
jgi:hypothetical protein